MEDFYSDNLCKGVIFCDTHDIVLNKLETNVSEIKRFIIITRNPPMCHNISLLILDHNLREKEESLISMLKVKYGDNLLCILDLQGNKL